MRQDAGLVPSTVTTLAGSLAAGWLPCTGLFSTPIEFSLPFHSHPHHPSSTISSLIAACYERHDFSLHCIQEQFLATPFSHLPARPDSNPDSTPDTPQFALGHLRYTPSSPLFTAGPTSHRLFPSYSHPPPILPLSHHTDTLRRPSSGSCSWRWVSTPVVTRTEADWNCMAGVWFC